MRHATVYQMRESPAVMTIAVKALFLLPPLRQTASSRSHRVLGRTMSSRRSPPRGNSGGFAFEVVADPAAVLPAVLDEDLIGVEPGREHARDVDARNVGLHGGRRVPGHAPGLVEVPQEMHHRDLRVHAAELERSLYGAVAPAHHHHALLPVRVWLDEEVRYVRQVFPGDAEQVG